MKEFIIKLKLDKPNDVGFLRRSVAYIIDWYIGGVLASLPLIIIYMINNDNVTIIPQNIEIFKYPLNIIVGLLSSWLQSFTMYLYQCIFMKGRHLGKR